MGCCWPYKKIPEPPGGGDEEGEGGRGLHERSSLVRSNAAQAYRHGGSMEEFQLSDPQLVTSRQSSASRNVSQFRYLHESSDYVKKKPEFDSIPQLQEAFMSVYQRYEIALVNRQKIDETLRSFKKVLDVEPNLHMAQCFEKWNSLLEDAVFTVKRTANERVKTITVRANQPREMWPAQKHIRDLLTACHLFMDQCDFILEAIEEGLGEVNAVTRNLNRLTDHLRAADQRDLRERVPKLRNEYDQIPGLLSMFKEDVDVLLREIGESAYCLPT